VYRARAFEVLLKGAAFGVLHDFKILPVIAAKVVYFDNPVLGAFHNLGYYLFRRIAQRHIGFVEFQSVGLAFYGCLVDSRLA